jgi:hypothetical protein
METSDLSFQERLLKIQTELKAPKNQYNNFGKYKYRNCEDILEALKPLLEKYGLSLILTDEIKELGGVIFTSAKVKVFDAEGTSAEVTAQAGIDPDKKGMDISQTFGSSSSYARKYALNGMFLIDDTKDADSQDNRLNNANNENKPKGKIRLSSSGEAFNKVKAFLQTPNGNMNAVKQKYIITPEVETLLNS